MNREEIRKQVEDNLRNHGLTSEELRLQPDPYGGWRIAVVSAGFEGKDIAERKAIALDGMTELPVEWLDLLTPAEREWAGSLPADIAGNEIPLWPEALARPEDEGLANVVFASDRDEDLPTPVVATFYSLRGGVGRSTAVAYTARILASQGFKVVCVDMDLEAPGLLTLFGKESEQGEEHGVVHLLTQLDKGEEPDLSKHLVRVDERDDLYCLPAGRPSAEYARLLAMIDPAAWYREENNPMRELLNRLEGGLPFRPDAILFDARTGITPLSGPLLFDLSDLDIIVMFPHPQAYAGTSALVGALLRSKTRRSTGHSRLTPEPRFVASPIPASKAPEVVARYQNRTLAWVAEWIEPVNRRRQTAAPLVESEITAFVPYRESVATSDQILEDQDTWRDYADVAGWIERFLPTETERREAVSLDGEKPRILRELHFSTGTAEIQKDFLDTFVETDIVRRALDPGIPLVVGRKGTGKTSVFRRLSEDPHRPAIIALAPRPLAGGKGWILGPEGFQAIENVLKETGVDWRQFWTFYVTLAIQQSEPNAVDAGPALRDLLVDIRTELDVRNAFAKVVGVNSFGLELNALLLRLDEGMHPGTFILFDGLDTGFGSNETDRQRREQAISGLFAFWADRGPAMRNAFFKIVLRDDIWRKVRFENKSHLYGRSVTLQWKDQASFYKVVVKQALQSQGFRSLVSEGRGGTRLDLSLDDWTESQVFRAWNLLVGERMKGGKTAFTRNWVWNRLADGNDDHSPRYLLQLFNAVAEWEKEEQRKAPYDRSVIRPRAFTAIFPQVSEQALEALREEMPELNPLLDGLRQVGRTPVPADELEQWGDLVDLAREVGLLSVYEGTSDKVERYKVPEIYRHALNMSRKGQM